MGGGLGLYSAWWAAASAADFPPLPACHLCKRPRLLHAFWISICTDKAAPEHAACCSVARALLPAQGGPATSQSAALGPCCPSTPALPQQWQPIGLPTAGPRRQLPPPRRCRRPSLRSARRGVQQGGGCTERSAHQADRSGGGGGRPFPSLPIPPSHSTSTLVLSTCAATATKSSCQEGWWCWEMPTWRSTRCAALAMPAVPAVVDG